MITKIKIENVATYKEALEIDNIKKVNFFYGSNGSGKTILSKLIANSDSYSDCNIEWQNNTKLKRIVYNEDFVRSVFYQNENFPGIFTMGEGAKDIEVQIDQKNQEREKIQNEQTSLNNTLKQKKVELNNKSDEFKELCWRKVYQKYQDDFTEVFTGYRNNKKNFAERLLNQYESNESVLRKNEYLLDLYNLLFKEELKSINLLNLISDEVIKELQKLETNEILKTEIIGKKDVDIARMIEKLHNHDWVRQGKKYYEENYDEEKGSYICPFCQQATTEDFKQKLEEYFDETYEKQVKQLDEFIEKYNELNNKLNKYFDDLLNTKDNKYFDAKKDELKSQIEIIKEKLKNNIFLINKKRDKPSEDISIEFLTDVIGELNNLINSINEEIKKYNEIVNNQQNEKNKLISEIWKFFCNEISMDIKSYLSGKNNIEKAIDDIKKQVEEKETKIKCITNEISELEKQIKSIKPTIDAINKVLDKFGFRGFKLAPTEDEKHYKIIREDETSAKETLSEGERNFIVFLYFYHLIQGALNPEENINEPKVVVFDDPVSSLDSDVLFIVATLIKGIIKDIREGKGNIKQVFLLTHNAYFHKEVTYSSSRDYGQNKRNDTMYFIIRKVNGISKIEEYETNPIKTTYQLLWDEIKNGRIDCVSLQNSMRRVIEFYFNTLADLKEEELINKFNNETDKKICRSLITWINVGSHDAFFDIDYSPSPDEISKYKDIFKKIFEETGHISHYNMMMGIPE